MRFLFALCSTILIPLSLAGQATLEIDTGQFADLESELLYEKAEDGVANLDNPPTIRLQYAELGLARAKREENIVMISDFATTTAVVYAEMGMNQEALKFSLESLRYARQTPSRYDDIWSLLRLSDIHSILRNPEQALQEGHECLRIALARDTLTEIGWSFNQLGETHRRILNYDSARYFYTQALETFEKAKDPRGVSFSHQNLGLNYCASGDYDQALEEFSISAKIGIETDVLFHLEQGEALVEIISHKFSPDSAISFGNSLVRLAEEGDYPRWQKQLKLQVADLYRKNEDWELAWRYHMEADSLEEIQTGERIRMQTSVADHQYRMQLLQAEHELRTQQSQNRNLRWILIVAVLGLIGIVTLIQITKNQRIRKINQRLFLQNDYLDELLKEKDIWINLMAHDLKAPLSAIKGLVEMLKDPNLPPPIREKALENITRSVDKGSELITQLLEIFRLESTEVKTDIQITNINELVMDTGRFFKPAADKKGITLQTEVPQDPVELPSDPVHTQRILENLVSNALKFSPTGKKVQLVVESQPDNVAIHVIDEGPGMSEEDQKNLFQKFRKLSAQPTGGESSTGLGLSIVKQLADRINARILVNSKAGEGATFTLSLPKQVG